MCLLDLCVCLDINMNMSFTLLVIVILLSCVTRVESSVQCLDLSSNKHFRGENIASRRPVSHTPVYINDKYNATLAADGNCDTKVSTSSPYTCSFTNRNNGTSPTWIVTLDKLYQITGIVIYNRDNIGHRPRLANFTVFGECDEQEQVVLYNDAGHNKYKSSILVLSVILLSCATRVESSKPCEDLSRNKHFRGDNIALKRQVSHEPATYNNDIYNATLAADGKCDTKFSTSSPYTCSLTNKNDGTSPTWTVTLDKTYQITDTTYRPRLANFTVFGECDEQEKVVLYNDAGNNKYTDRIIHLEINGPHLCSTISIQIPQESVSGKVQYLALCEVQVYAAVCSKPTSSFVTDISPNRSLYTKDESLNFQCKIGYRPSPSNATVTCCGVDTFCPSSPVCERVYCQLHSQPDNGKYNTSTSTNTSLEYGSVIYGECNIGYKEEISDTTRRCQQNGTWSGQDLVCTQIKCNPPPSVQNGYYTYTDNNTYMYIREPYNTNLTGYCNVGYNLLKPSTLFCSLNETWIGDLPICNIITCDSPTVTENSYYTYDNNNAVYNGRTELFDTTLLGRCNIGFKLILPSELKCSQNGKWKGILPTCEHITCEMPYLHNGYYINTTNTLYYKNELVPVCDEGFSLKNNNKIVCNEYGKWSYKTAKCVPGYIVKEELFSTGMVVGIVLGAVVFTTIITTVIVYIVMKRSRQAITKPNNLYGDLALRNASNDGDYTNIQNVQQN